MRRRSVSVAVFSLVLFKEAVNRRTDQSRKVYHYQGFYLNNSVEVAFLFNIIIDEILLELRITDAALNAAQSNQICASSWTWIRAKI